MSVDLKADQIDSYNYGEGSISGLTSDQLMRQSFNRFDDNLVENILSYLTFNQKVLFESVSKRWKKCVYNQQKKLCLTGGEEEDHNSLNKLLKPIEVVDLASGQAAANEMKAINKFSLISILKKCHSIESIDLDCFVDFEDLDIIGTYGHNLKSIVLELMGLSANDLDLFGQRYGLRLQLVEFHSVDYYSEFRFKYCNKLLIHCKNLREFRCCKFTELFSGDKEYLPKLECVSDYNLNQDDLKESDETPRFEMFCNKYSQTLKKVRIFSRCQMNSKQMDSFLTNVCKFKNLQDLDLSVRVKSGYEVGIYDHLRRLAKNNPQMTTLKLMLNKKFYKHDKIFLVFELFKNLVELSIDIKNSNHRKAIKASIEYFKSSKRLKSLRIAYKQISEDFFEDIDRHLPNLSKLSILCETEITDKTILRLSRLKKLKEFSLGKYHKCNKEITDESICALINGCPSLQKLYFGTRPNITNKSIEALICCANAYPKRIIDFECGLSLSGEENQFEAIDLDSFVHRIPENLKINMGNNMDDN